MDVVVGELFSAQRSVAPREAANLYGLLLNSLRNFYDLDDGI
jgi:hypothetical protein